MRIVVVTHYPEAIVGFIDAATHYDRQVPGWGTLQLFNSTGPLHDDEASRLRDALAGAEVIIVDLMRSEPGWHDAMAPAIEAHRGQLLSFGMQFADRTRLGDFDMATARAAAPRPGMPAAAPPPRPEDPGARRDAATFAALTRAYRAMRGDDARFILGPSRTAAAPARRGPPGSPPARRRPPDGPR